MTVVPKICTDAVGCSECQRQGVNIVYELTLRLDSYRLCGECLKKLRLLIDELL